MHPTILAYLHGDSRSDAGPTDGLLSAGAATEIPLVILKCVKTQLSNKIALPMAKQVIRAQFGYLNADA